MEMEFKDSSRRRTLVLIVGVMLALVAGAGVFYLSSQGGRTGDPTTALPTREIVVAIADIPARDTIDLAQLTTRVVPADATNETAFTDPTQVAGGVAAVTILALQPISPNLLAGAANTGISILAPTETISPTSPLWRAVSINIPPDRAVGGFVAAGSRVDILATIPITIEPEIDEVTGEEVATELVSEQSTKLAWMDVPVLQGGTDGAAFIFKMDLHQAEEVAHAQTAGASFTILLRPLGDNREVDRSTYGETTNRIIEQYNFPIPEQLDTANYPQPSTFPSPFPNQPYLTPAPSVEPSPSPIAVVASPSPAP
jgi:Flp pilus assembly protein CpaB